MDITTLVGLIIVFSGLIIGVVMEGASLFMYLNLPAAFIVLVGTFGVTTVTTSLDTVVLLPVILAKAFGKNMQYRVEIVEVFTKLLNKARKEGILSLEAELQNIDNKFFSKGLQLVIDGIDPKLVEKCMETEMIQLEDRHQKGIGFFEAAGGFAPTLGIMGTVMGLVNILANLSNPDEIGSMISVAFIATLYGVGAANVFLLPIANKLKAKSEEELVTCEMILEGLLSLQSGDNPKFVEERLKAYLTPEEREELD